MKRRRKDTIETTEIVGGYRAPQAPEFYASGEGHYVINMPKALPVVNMVDENGNLYQAQTFYRPLPNSSPVAVPTPPSVVQLTPIVAPMTIVPYISQEQPLYQYDDED